MQVVIILSLIWKAFNLPTKEKKSFRYEISRKIKKAVISFRLDGETLLD